MPMRMLDICQRPLNRLQCLSGNQVKLFAAAFMLVDHFSKIFLIGLLRYLMIPMENAGYLAPGISEGLYTFTRKVLYSIGAISFPVFCFMFAEGFPYTKSKLRYCLRLALFAIISEIPFDLAFFRTSAVSAGTFPLYYGHQNVFFTFLIGIGALICIDWLTGIPNRWLRLLLQLAAAAVFGKIAGVIRCDYGTYGVLLMAVFYLFRKNRLLQAAAGLALRFLVFSSRGYPYSFLAASVMILLYNGHRGKRNLKYFFYLFYPSHIIILYLLTRILPRIPLPI